MNMTANQNPWVTRLTVGILIIIAVSMVSNLWQGDLLPEGAPAPSWNLPLADGTSNTMGIDQLRGKVVILDFWSTTCPPCLRQIAELEALQKQMTHENVSIIGVTAGGEDLELLRNFAKDRNIRYPLVLDEGGVSDAYKVRSLPTLYIIDKQGNVAASHRGFWPRESLATAVRNHL